MPCGVILNWSRLVSMFVHDLLVLGGAQMIRGCIIAKSGKSEEFLPGRTWDSLFGRIVALSRCESTS